MIGKHLLVIRFVSGFVRVPAIPVPGWSDVLQRWRVPEPPQSTRDRATSAATSHAAVCRPHGVSVDDEVLALCLYTVWALRTGRPLPTRPYTDLTRPELEEFWSDHVPTPPSAIQNIVGQALH